VKSADGYKIADVRLDRAFSGTLSTYCAASLYSEFDLLCGIGTMTAGELKQ
jgi:hypothetical protein